MRTRRLRRQLLAELESVNRRLTPDHDGSPRDREHDPIDEANTASHEAVEDQRRHLLRLRAHAIRLALERMDAGEYGLCSGCGEPIDPARLEAIPWADLCRDCQRIEELGMSPTPTPVTPPASTAPGASPPGSGRSHREAAGEPNPPRTQAPAASASIRPEEDR